MICHAHARASSPAAWSSSSSVNPAKPSTTVEGFGARLWQYRLRGWTRTDASAARSTSSLSESRGRVSRKWSPASAPEMDTPGISDSAPVNRAH